MEKQRVRDSSVHFSFKRFVRTAFQASFALAILSLGCTKSPANSANQNSVESTGQSLFVASGSCYAGGNTTLAGSGTVVAYDESTGEMSHVVIDYNSFSPGDQPVGLSEFDSDHLLVVVENPSGRRIDLVKKDGSGSEVYLTNSTALSTVLRSVTALTDGSLLISKSSAVEKFSAGKARVTQNAGPYINAPGSTCATATTLITSVVPLSNGNLVFSHSAATPNNKLDVISATGYATTADCLATQAAPTTLALPTALVSDAGGKLLVAYASTTNASNFIYSYSFNASNNTLSSPTVAFSDPGIINGPSAMTEDPTDESIFVANGSSTFNDVEKFTLNPTTGVLTRTGSAPFIAPSVYTRCVSSLKVMSNP